MATHRILAIIIACAPLAACGIGDVTGVGGGGVGAGGGDGSSGGADAGGGGGGGDGDGGGPGSPDGSVARSLTVSVAPVAEKLTLGTSTRLHISVTSNNFSGPVDLSVAGAPGSWQIGDAPALSFEGSGTRSATIQVTIPTNGAGIDATLTVIATADIGEQQAEVLVSAANRYLIPIANRTGATGNHGFPRDVRLRKGAVVRFINYDTTSVHRIHSDAGSAFPHEGGEMAKAPSAGEKGGTYSITTTKSGTYTFYCHDHGPNTGIGSVIVAP